jgi:Domain of unknown function (DUF4145)/Sigma-70, region 4
MQEQHLFYFLEKDLKALADLGEKIEQSLFADPHSVLIKARLFCEQIIKVVYQNEKLNEVYELKHVERLHKLLREGIITEEIYEKFEWIRKEGNKAAHEPQYGSVEDSLRAHRYIYDIAVWYMELYGDVTFTPPSYRIPKLKQSHSIDKTELGDLINQTIQKTLGYTFEEKFKSLQDELKRLKEQEINKIESNDSLHKNDKANHSSFRLIEYLRSKGLEVIDERTSGGTIWVVGGWELNEILFPLKEQKIYFRFTQNGSWSTKRRPAWYLLGKYEGEREDLSNEKQDTIPNVENVISQEQDNTVIIDNKVFLSITKEKPVYHKVNESQLYIPDHLLHVELNLYSNTQLSHFADIFGIKYFCEITDDHLRQYYQQHQESFYRLLIQLSFVGVKFSGDLQKLANIEINEDLGFVEVKDLTNTVELKEIFPPHIQNILYRFGIKNVQQLNGVPISMLKWIFDNLFDEVLSILKKYAEKKLENEQVLTVSSEKETIEPKRISLKNEFIIIPTERLMDPIKPEDFPGCNTLVRGLLNNHVKQLKDLPNRLDELHLNLKHVGPGAVKKFWNHLVNRINISPISATQTEQVKQGEQILFDGEILDIPAFVRSKPIDKDWFVSVDSLLNSMEEQKIQTYEQIPAQLDELLSIQGVGRSKVKKFFHQLKLLFDHLIEEEKRQSVIQKMTKEEQITYFFSEFQSRIEKVLQNPEMRKEYKLNERAIELFQLKHQELLNGKYLTLEELGNRYDVSRERIRQILKTFLTRIFPLGREWIELLNELVKEHKVIYNTIIDQQQFTHFLAVELLEQYDIKLIYEDRIFTNLQRHEVSELEQQIKQELVNKYKGKLITKDDLTEFITKQQLPKYFVEFVIFENVIETPNGHYILNNYTKADIVEMVLKQYPFGVEVYKNADELCKQGNAIVPGTFDNEREFTSVLGREEFTDIAYLWGRGVYIHHSFVQVNQDLLNKIAKHITQLLETRDIISIGKIYQSFEEELKENHVPNEYALYFLLRKFTKEPISFPKFPRVTKEGEDIKNNSDMIKDFIRKTGQKVSFEQLKEEFIIQRGWKRFTLEWNLSNDPEILKADWGVYTLSEFYQSLSHEDLQPIIEKVKSKLKHSPFIQIRGVFHELESYCKGLGIDSYRLLYDLLRERYRDLFRFPRFPHILRSDAEIDSISMYSIIEDYILEQGREVSREEVLQWITEEIGGRSNILDNTLSYSDNIFYYTRGQYGEYIHKDVLGWNEKKQKELRHLVLKKLEAIQDRPFILAKECFDEESLPKLEIDLSWTIDLLIDCLKRDPEFLLLGSMNTIILLSSNAQGIRTNTDFVAYVIAQEYEGAVKLNELRKRLKEYQYSSDGELLFETLQDMEEGKAPFVRVGDELILKALLSGIGDHVE